MIFTYVYNAHLTVSSGSKVYPAILGIY